MDHTPKTEGQQEALIIRLDPSKAAEAAVEIPKSVAAEVAEGFNLSLWASDSLIFDPVALAFTNDGTAYYTSTNRRRNSEIDIRRHMEWATESIHFQSVEDRRNFIRNTIVSDNPSNNDWLKDENQDSLLDWRDLTVLKEEVYAVKDESGDGIADFAQRFLADFNDEVSDVCNGLLPFENEVYVGIAPDLWKVTDTDGDGTADEKVSLAHGFGVHIGFGGHNLSGVTMGPDGRIYWGIGDIGMNLRDAGGKEWKYPNEGVIVRANPDGSDFEVFASGLRNTHEFVFDEYGNLISEDNDGDHPGEMERLVYLINGSDSGWRINWQFGKYTDPDNNRYKVWMDEGLYKPRFEGQAAFILPTIMNYRNGPTGMRYNPGTALNSKWKNHFFLVEFVGASARSTLNAFTLKPEGAGFAFGEEHQILKGILATGIDFAPDGSLYLADWIEGWEPKNKGRIWKLDVDQLSDQEKLERVSTKEALAADFKSKSAEDLYGYLFAPDIRVRQKAQFELVNRGETGMAPLKKAIDQQENQLARIHGIWGIGQLARKNNAFAPTLLTYLNDPDPEIVAQCAKTLGDIKYQDTGNKLFSLLKHASLRVRFFATEALGRIQKAEAVGPILEMLLENNDKDVYLRHGAAIALARIGDADALIKLNTHPSRALKIVAVVALRRMQHPGVATFLNDADEWIVTEAARAINDDWSITQAMQDLARVIKNDRFSSEALIRRAINANLRSGHSENIKTLLDYACKKTAPEVLRAEALATLGTWGKPSVLDRVDGRYRGIIDRDIKPVQVAFAPKLEELLSDKSPLVQTEAIIAAGKLNMFTAAPIVLDLAGKSPHPSARIAALQAINRIKPEDLPKALATGFNDKEKNVRVAAFSLLEQSALPDHQQVELMAALIDKASLEEQQVAVGSLGRFASVKVEEILKDLLNRLKTGKLNPALELELENAITASSRENLKEALKNILESRNKTILDQYSAALMGGNGRNGQNIFNAHETAQCTRCHKIAGEGSDVGPALAGISKRLTPKQILQSLVDPSAIIAPGYGVETIELQDGKTVVGILQSENNNQLLLKTGQTAPVIVLKSQISKRTPAPSSMPPMGSLLTKGEIRDLVAYLGGL